MDLCLDIEGVEHPSSSIHSGKMVVLMSLILESKKAGDQVVVFSRWLHCLTFVEEMIERFNNVHASGDGKTISLCMNGVPSRQCASCILLDSTRRIRVLRFDGRTTLCERNSLISDFVQQSSTADVMLISTLCGEGISLVSANRVVILDVNWNPSHDQQAALRVRSVLGLVGLVHAVS